MCGGVLTIKPGETVCECEFCGMLQTVPSDNAERKNTQLARANDLRFSRDFDKASMAYECVISDFPNEPEAYWGLVLCEYGIEYIGEKDAENKILVCHKASYESVFDNANYQLAISKSDPIACQLYMEEAARIESIRKEIIEVAQQTEPYDVFICYKEQDAFGNHTQDCLIAQDVYAELVKNGYNVFFSHITLMDKLGINYEPYIFAALHSSKIMLVFATNSENVNSIWVKNEWQRYLNLIEKGERKTIIPCFENMSVSSLPKELARFQAQDMSKNDAIKNLLCGIKNLLKAQLKESNAIGRDSSVSDVLVERGMMALEDEEFLDAIDHFEKALDLHPKEAQAYLGIFLANRKVPSLKALENTIVDYLNDKNFKRAMQFSDQEHKKVLMRALEVNENNEKKRMMHELVCLLRKGIKDKEREHLCEQTRIKREKKAADEKAYKEACELLESKISQETQPIIKKIMLDYEPMFSQLRIQNGEKQAHLLKDKTNCEIQITTLQKRKGSLGFFERTEKRELQQEIESARTKLDQIIERLNQLTVSAQMQMFELEQRRNDEIDAVNTSVRSKYPFPKQNDSSA